MDWTLEMYSFSFCLLAMAFSVVSLGRAARSSAWDRRVYLLAVTALSCCCGVLFGRVASSLAGLAVTPFSSSCSPTDSLALESYRTL